MFATFRAKPIHDGNLHIMIHTTISFWGLDLFVAQRTFVCVLVDLRHHTITEKIIGEQCIFRVQAVVAGDHGLFRENGDRGTNARMINGSTGA
jgi:hypothetical protein